MDTPESVVQASIDAYNAHDVNAYIALFTPAATFGQLGGRILPPATLRRPPHHPLHHP
jgi:hypothetical protein